jgi:NAD kinase/nicotinic acid mononucleotide adenylyltransferase
MTTLADLQTATARALDGTPPDPRLADLLSRITDAAHLKQEVGGLLAALLQLCARNGWDAGELTAAAVRALEAVPPPPAPPVAGPPPARKVAVYTGSFDPPTRFHRAVAERLRAEGFDEVIIRPAGPRADRPEAEHAAPIHRAVMTDLAFRDLPGVSVDLTDLDDRAFSPHRDLERAYAARGEVWQVVSDEFVEHGRDGDSTIQTRWEHGPEMWAASRFAVFHPTSSPPDRTDLPAACRLVAVDGHVPTADLRAMVFSGGPDAAEELVPPGVAEYIRRHGLFTSAIPPREVRITVGRPRLKIVTGPQAESRELAGRFRHLEAADPNLLLVLGGDGTMLHAIREHWRLRLPFLGLNAGHLGHLMNEHLPDTLAGAELVLYRMPMLRVDTVGEDGAAAQALAFNDAWLERDGGQGAWLRVDVNGQERVSKVVADGLLVATPSGSSAYARAMGATPVPLNSPVITLAGSNVFRPRFWKPLALPDDTAVRMTSVGDPAKRPVRCFIDGLPVGRVRALEARVSSVAAVELAFTPEFDLSAKLLRSMFPPDDGGA